MKSFNFYLPTKIIFGTGRIKELRANIPPGSDNILIVTDKNVAEKSGALDSILIQLKDKNVEIFNEVKENSPLFLLKKGKDISRRKNIQMILGVGGGSSMDTAKGIAVLATNSGNMIEFLEGKELTDDPLPVVCIPTTSGTGSEVTPYAVFTDPENKRGYSNSKIFPLFSIIDPELTYSMPENVIINTGIDALIHSIEAFLSAESFLLNDQLALQAISIIMENLRHATKKNRGAMQQLSYAAMIAGVAITHAGTILLHVMSYPLTVFHGIPHGRANAILLPGFIEFMKERSSVKEKVCRLEQIFKDSGGIKNFVAEFNIEPKLSAYGIREDEIPVFVEKTIVKDDVKITPAEITKQDIFNIYTKHL